MLRVLQTVCLITFVLVLASNGAAKVERTEKNHRWHAILALLNAAPDPKDSMPFTNGIEEDLLELNRKEIKEIEGKYQEKAPRKLPKTGEELRKENRFFQEQVEALNAPLFKALAESAQRRSSFRDHRGAAKEALLKIEANQRTKPQNVYKFKDGDQIGFCFGRALLIYYWLLKKGVPQSDIAKVFAIGELNVQKIFWKFHVAIWIRDPKEGYIVVDPLQKDWMPYAEWIKINQAYDIKSPYSRVRFYMTPPSKFMPSFGAYDLKQLEDPLFQGYFNDFE